MDNAPEKPPAKRAVRLHEPFSSELDGPFLAKLRKLLTIHCREPLPKSARGDMHDVISGNVAEADKHRDEPAEGMRIDAEGDRDKSPEKSDRESAKIGHPGEFRATGRVLLARRARAPVSAHHRIGERKAQEDGRRAVAFRGHWVQSFFRNYAASPGADFRARFPASSVIAG